MVPKVCHFVRKGCYLVPKGCHFVPKGCYFVPGGAIWYPRGAISYPRGAISYAGGAISYPNAFNWGLNPSGTRSAKAPALTTLTLSPQRWRAAARIARPPARGGSNKATWKSIASWKASARCFFLSHRQTQQYKQARGGSGRQRVRKPRARQALSTFFSPPTAKQRRRAVKSVRRTLRCALGAQGRSPQAARASGLRLHHRHLHAPVVLQLLLLIGAVVVVVVVVALLSFRLALYRSRRAAASR